jgi:hypothetical protein
MSENRLYVIYATLPSEKPVASAKQPTPTP